MSDTNYAVIYDLHSHTTASDGLLTPETLVHRAVEMRVGTLAITDHDTTAAIPAAREEISRCGLALNLIPGVEISTVWENHEIHIVGLNIDIAHPAMRDFLAQQTQRRQARGRLIAERLEKAHIPGAWEGALRLANGGAVTRGHFARFLVECGKAATMADVFKKYLARGKTGYVPPQWCTIEQAIDVIHHSGGNAPNWRRLRVSIIYGHRLDLISISPARGLNWGVNSGCPLALKAYGRHGNSRKYHSEGSMSQFFYIHPDNPQQRLINQAVDIVRKGGVIVYPTDSGYALGCKIEDKGAMERICRIRHLPDGHNFTLMCRDLSELSTYSYVDNVAFRLMKNNTPGNYTFILKGTKEVPRRLLQEKRKTIGLRVPSNPIALALLDTLGEPMLSTSLMLPGSDFTESDPEEIKDRLEKQVDLIIHGGYLGQQPTTVIDLTNDSPVVLREGVGDVTPFL